MRQLTKTLLTTLTGVACAAATVLTVPSAATAATPRAYGGPGPRSDSLPMTVPSQGGQVGAPARPTRILSLSASATQMLYVIGAGKQVVGVDRYSTWPPGAPRTKFTGGETDAEGYLRLHPDLVVMAYASGTVLKQLQLLHVPTLVLPPAADLAQIYQQMDELGAATGHAASARQAVATLRSYVAGEVRYAAGAGRGRSYFLELSPSYYTATSHTFVGAEMAAFGLRDVADPAGHGNAYPQVSAEFLLGANPTYVLLADSVCCAVTPASFAHRPGFAALTAVRDHRVTGVNDSLASQWGPHTVEQFTTLVAHLLRP